jgi:hypothetical protein
MSGFVKGSFNIEKSDNHCVTICSTDREGKRRTSLSKHTVPTVSSSVQCVERVYLYDTTPMLGHFHTEHALLIELVMYNLKEAASQRLLSESKFYEIMIIKELEYQAKQILFVRSFF